MLTLSTALLTAVAKWATPSLDRPHLAQVVIRDKEIFATDGHRLVRVPIDTDLEIAIYRKHILAAAAAQRSLNFNNFHDDDADDDEPRPRSPRSPSLGISKADGALVRIDLDLDAGSMTSMTVTAGHLDLAITRKQLDAAVPAPSLVSPSGHIFNPQYLAAIDEVNAALGGERTGVKCVAWGAPNADGEFHGAMTFQGAQGSRFVIMPMRGSW
jgi:hypothetical protein